MATTTNSREPLHILKASAGSGKTHRLTNEYIDLLLGDKNCPPENRPSEDKYKHILAVTFTNKATDEMKTRILGALYDISKDENDPRKKYAGKVLTKILHDYSLFSVSTIDTFFQKAMRAFAREIGQYASYKVEINTQEVIDAAVDAMMAELDGSSSNELLQWLIEYSYEQVQEGEYWDIESNMQTLAALFMREDFKIKKESVGFTTSKDDIRGFKKELNKIIFDFEKQSKEYGETGLKIMDSFGLQPESFKGGSRSKFNQFRNLQQGKIVNDISEKFNALYNNPDEWKTKTSKDAAAIDGAYSGGLNDLVGDIILFYTKSYPQYATAAVYRKNLNILGIFSDLYRIMNDLLKQNNSVLLSETTDVLNRIIDKDDSPFIYEKIGTRYDNYMLDEFQDTSDMQWGNLFPLVLNSVSQNGNNLIVGDVKQSIYRFRNSDWKLLDSEIEKQFNGTISTEPMKENWRSLAKIVEFNYDVFAPSDDTRKSIGGIIALDEPAIGSKIESIYSDSLQTIPSKRQGNPDGYVRLTFVQKEPDPNIQYDMIATDSWKANSLALIPEQIELLKKNGYKMSDIAFLVRKNKEAACVAEFLMNNGYKVTTDEALAVSCSPSVRKAVSYLKKLVNENDLLNNLTFVDAPEFQQISVDGSSLFEICEKLFNTMGSDILPEEIPFVQTFLDGVMDFSSKSGSTLTGYLKWWDEYGYKASISVPSDDTAIKVMTIHKSKGLGFKVVFIPFLSDSFLSNLDNYIWTALDIPPFDKIGLVPINVKSRSNLKSTLLSDAVEEEIMMSYIDVVNTNYVAFTRPKDALFIYAPLPVNNSKQFSNILYKKFESALQNNVYELGTLPTASTDKDGNDLQEELAVTDYISEPIGDRLKQSGNASDFFDEEQQLAKHHGIVMHDILSRIDSAEDLDKSIVQARDNGEIKSDEFEQIKSLLTDALKEISDRGWFDGRYRNMNEVSIVDGAGQVHRPDRVLVDTSSSKVIVIDYKFGAYKKQYFNQVSAYCELIREMGYKNVEGYIWYVGDHVENVEP